MLEVIESKVEQGMHPESISALAAAAKSDPASFGHLYDHYIQPVYRYIRSRVATAAEAEDLASQTFIAAFESLPGYHERGYFSAWLFRIARSKLTDHFRRNKYEIPLDAVEGYAVREDALGHSVHSDNLRQLIALIQLLDDGDRELIRLRYVADLSFAEMAQVLGKREAAVKKSLYRLLASMKSQME